MYAFSTLESRSMDKNMIHNGE